MKAFLIGIVIALLLATAAAFVLDSEFQQSAEQHFRTEAVRL